MSVEMIDRITHSLDELERAVNSAHRAVPAAVLSQLKLSSRIDSYREVVRRQRALVISLSNAIETNDWNLVLRLTELVRASAHMVQLDAQQLLLALRHGAALAQDSH